jgi:hypothetical protein
VTTGVDKRLLAGDPDRRRVLTLLNERVATASQISGELVMLHFQRAAREARLR